MSAETTIGPECCYQSGYTICMLEHVTPVLQDFHWLPVHQHVAFQVALLVTGAYVGLRHPILQSFVHQFPTSQADSIYDLLIVVYCLFPVFSQHSFAVHGPALQ